MSRRERRRAVALQVALAQLPGQLRAVFDVVAVEGASYTEAAGRLGINAGEVEQRLAAALVMLDKALATPLARGLWQRLVRRFGQGSGG